MARGNNRRVFGGVVRIASGCHHHNQHRARSFFSKRKVSGCKRLMRVKPFILCTTFVSALPEYCSKVGTPVEQADFEQARSIPALSVETARLGLQLLHVSNVIRHGARTLAYNYSCWNNYNHHWDCDVEESTRIVAPDLDGSDSSSSGSSEFNIGSVAYRKVYDAKPEQNLLKGTCGLGHLLNEGYKQHVIMGRTFAEHYKSLSPPLIGKEATKEDLAEMIWFRSSDIQRTILSGSSWLTSFLESTVDVPPGDGDFPLHTLDVDADYIFPNYKSCPKLRSIKEQIYASETFAEITNKYADTKNSLAKYLDTSSWPGQFFDCMMTQICTEGIDSLRPSFPDLDVQHVIDQTIKAVDELTLYQFTANDRLYASTANIKFLIDFKTEIVRALIADVTQRIGTTQPTVAAEKLAKVIPKQDLNEFYKLIVKDGPFLTSRRLALYSAHDTSILQFLGSLGDTTFLQKWPPYASQVTMELYSADEDYYFRLIYNGVVITDRIKECGSSNPNDVCSVRQAHTRAHNFSFSSHRSLKLPSGPHPARWTRCVFRRARVGRFLRTNHAPKTTTRGNSRLTPPQTSGS